MSQKDATFGGHKAMPSLPKASRSGLQCEAGRLRVFQASFCTATQRNLISPGWGNPFFFGHWNSVVFPVFFLDQQKESAKIFRRGLMTFSEDQTMQITLPKTNHSTLEKWWFPTGIHPFPATPIIRGESVSFRESNLSNI